QVEVVFLLDPVVHGPQVADELLGLLGVRGPLGDDLDDSGVGGGVGGGQQHRVHPVERFDLFGEILEQPQRVGGGDDGSGDDERAVEPFPELVVDDFVGDARGFPLGQGGGV